MPGTFFKMDDRAARKRIKKFIAAGRDLEPALKAFGEHMIKVTDDRFSGEHAPDGSRWAALSPATLATKKGSKILTESSGLRGSVIYSTTPKKMAYGTNKIYGAIHQFGGKAGRGGKVIIPQREFLGITAADMKEWRETIEDHMNL